MKKSRILALLLCLCMLVGVLAACSKTDTTTSDASGETAQSGDTAKTGDVVTIRMWGGVPAESGPQAACDAFNEAYKDKGIQVEYERFVNDDTGNVKLETNLLGGNEIDVYMSYTMAQLSKRAEGNMALDLTELCERDGFDLTQYLGDLATSYYIDGKPASPASSTSTAWWSTRPCSTRLVSKSRPSGRMTSSWRPAKS